MASSEIIRSITPQKIHTDPVSDKRANTAKNVRNIESKQQTKTTRERKISRKKISQKNDFNGNCSQYHRQIKHLCARQCSKTVFT